MDNKIKYYISDIPVYRGKLIVAIGNNNKEIHDKFEIGYDNDKDLEGVLGFVWNYRSKEGNRRYLVWFPKKPKASILAHEVVHIVNKVFQDVGVNLDTFNDEPQTYFTDCIFDMVEESISRIEKGKYSKTIDSEALILKNTLKENLIKDGK